MPHIPNSFTLAEKASQVKYTRSQRKESLTELNKSAITDHVARANHIIDWEGASILEREENRKARWIRESIWIRRRGTKTMNRDEGVYNLSHVYDPLITPTSNITGVKKLTTTSGQFPGKTSTADHHQSL